jgi:hypothetical protein
MNISTDQQLYGYVVGIEASPEQLRNGDAVVETEAAP